MQKSKFFRCWLVLLIFIPISLLPILSRSQQPDSWELTQNADQPPEQVMDSIGVKAGMSIGEVGAGRGRYVVYMASRVGATGRIYANDIDPHALEYLKQRCERDSISNVTIVPGTVTEPRLPSGGLDLVYMINTYHHLEQPVALIKNIIPCLKPTGKLVIIEHDPVKFPSGRAHATARELVIKQAQIAGFQLERQLTFLKKDNIFIFTVRK